MTSCKTFRENFENRKIENRLTGEWIFQSGAFLPGIDLANKKTFSTMGVDSYMVLKFNKDRTVSVTRFREPDAALKDSTDLITIQESNWFIENQNLRLKVLYTNYMWIEKDKKMYPYKKGINYLYRIEFRQDFTKKVDDRIFFFPIVEFSKVWDPK
ncbi:hypothetical protein [Flavobacterium sp. LM4]|uniref:hypothetical protein n=1 Tax=Flavobacterium sp. LM4 TaxID=1938609 RepID=UPI0009933CD3|nr:hypothetical protein [Flavobacterium sp. LM4]OOV18485.1 hypothetical protein BXU10_01880 [Flavobacterium sp. LM4]